jgi:small redox-active disulfide protein 2
MKIEVLGPGCKNCETLYLNVLRAVATADLGSRASISKVADEDYFFKLQVFATPALVVDGKVLSVGKLLGPEEILDLFRQNGILD